MEQSKLDYKTTQVGGEVVVEIEIPSGATESESVFFEKCFTATLRPHIDNPIACLLHVDAFVLYLRHAHDCVLAGKQFQGYLSGREVTFDSADFTFRVARIGNNGLKEFVRIIPDVGIEGQTMMGKK